MTCIGGLLDTVTGSVILTAKEVKEVEDHIDQLEAENDKLRELGKQYELVIVDYRAENAKLRELVRDMMVAWWACDNERCPRHDERCEEGKFCTFDECARDLGIEVDE